MNTSHTLSDLLFEPVDQEVMVGLGKSCDLPQQVSVDHIGAGARILWVLYTNSTTSYCDKDIHSLIFYLETSKSAAAFLLCISGENTTTLRTTGVSARCHI